MVLKGVGSVGLLGTMMEDKEGGWGGRRTLLGTLKRKQSFYYDKNDNGSNGTARGGELIGTVRSGMAMMATKLRELEENHQSVMVLRESENSEHEKSKEYFNRIHEISRQESEKNRNLEKQVSALSEECLMSVPKDRLTFLEEELKKGREREAEVTRAYAEVVGKNKEMEEEQRVVGGEVEELNKRLVEEKAEVKKLKKEGKGIEDNIYGKEEKPVRISHKVAKKKK